MKMVGSSSGGNEGNGGSLDGALIDRGKVKILLCDKDPESCLSVMDLLCKCSYQVTLARSARQVVDALNIEGPDIDIILMEADLPAAKGMKLLKHITRDANLQRIPVIMMSAVDEVSLVFKSLKLGAADFLVKPLRTNELLNLWTHMWRRRRMLGLDEKSILSSDGELIGSDLSNKDMNSATLISEGTDNNFTKKADSKKGAHQEDETCFAAEFSSGTKPGDMYSSGVEEGSQNQTGSSFFNPKKNKLNIGSSSAFFTYTKSGFMKDQTVKIKESDKGGSLKKDISERFPYSPSAERVQTPNIVSEHPPHLYSAEDETSDRPSCYDNDSQANMPGFYPHPAFTYGKPAMTPHFQAFTPNKPSNKPGYHANALRANIPRFNPNSAYPYLNPGVTNQMMMPHYYPQINQSFVQYQYPPYMPPMMVPYPSHYPTSICPQPGHVSNANPSPSAVTNSDISKREAALIKFRRKRNERSFDKKIRYANRKSLAESRPRVKGQFVSKSAGAAAVDTNGCSTPNNEDEVEDDDNEEHEEEDGSNPATQDSLTQNNHSDLF